MKLVDHSKFFRSLRTTKQRPRLGGLKISKFMHKTLVHKSITRLVTVFDLSTSQKNFAGEKVVMAR